MAESAAQLRWQELEAQLPVEIIEMPYYKDARAMRLLQMPAWCEIPDWHYWQDIEFMIQQNW